MNNVEHVNGWASAFYIFPGLIIADMALLPMLAEFVHGLRRGIAFHAPHVFDRCLQGVLLRGREEGEKP